MTGLVILFVVFVRIRLLSVPLERDEGEYAYMGQLLLKGYSPFAHAYNMKLPGTSMMYALIMLLFGQTVTGVHIGLLLVNVCSTIFLFIGVKRVFNPLVAFVAASAFALLTLSPPFLGTAAHATHFVMFFALAGMLLAHQAIRREKTMLTPLFSGVLLGMSILMKQPGVFFAMFVVFMAMYYWLFVARTSFSVALKNVGIVIAGILLPILCLFCWLFASGMFDRFWFWTIQYGSEYAAIIPWSEGVEFLKSFFISSFNQYAGIWILALLGMLSLWFLEIDVHRKIFLIVFAACSFLAVCPGFYFRKHYFVLFAPAAGLLAGIGAEAVRHLIVARWKARSISWLVTVLVLIVLCVGIVKSRLYYLEYSPQEVSKMLYRGNPFSESLLIGDYIRQHTDTDDKIAVLGSEPQIYFYANRISATGYLYMYSLMEPQPWNGKMQTEMIHEIETANPKILVLFRMQMSWLRRPESPMIIFNWFENYTNANYYLTGVAEISEGKETSFFWDEQARARQPSVHQVIYIFTRKDSSHSMPAQ